MLWCLYFRQQNFLNLNKWGRCTLYHVVSEMCYDEIRGLSNKGYLTETHLKLKSRVISFVPNIRLRNPTIFKILRRARQYHCRACSVLIGSPIWRPLDREYSPHKRRIWCSKRKSFQILHPLLRHVAPSTTGLVASQCPSSLTYWFTDYW